MVEKVETTLNGATLSLETGKVAKQANGAVMARLGDTMILCTAVMNDTPRDGIDFFPLTCDIEERFYAAGKIPGSFHRREGRPGEKAVLSSRLMDRPIRPLFPKGFRNDVQLIGTVMSVDGSNWPDVVAIVGASAALHISDIPFAGPIGAVRVGRVNGEFIVNPTLEQLAESDLDLVVAGTADNVMMIEAGAQEVSEDDMIAAISWGHEQVKPLCALQEELRAKVGKPKLVVASKEVAEDAVAAVKPFTQEIRDSIQNPDKASRENAISEMKKEIVERVTTADETFADRKKEIAEAVEKIVKQQIRALILEEGKRPDGRGLKDIRPLSAEVGLLPRAHGSALFSRGQTQVMSVTTLGSLGDEQLLDQLMGDQTKRWTHHYNFPPYSVGEARPMRGTGRREVGHGALAERGLKAVLPAFEDFPYVLRVVSDVLESNGSSSMASTCGTSLALMDAGVPIKAHVAGIAMGLMSEGDKYAVLTDIQGMEDFSGDMDFKVAGTRNGITAIQMDTKLGGIPEEVFRGAIHQALEARLQILDVMEAAISAPREALSLFAPRIFKISINPEQIGTVIGPGGKTIKKIQAETGAKIDIEQDGTVYIAAVDGEGGENAKKMVEALTKTIEAGEVYTGEVVRIMPIGAFVELVPGKDGLVHISELAPVRVNRVEDVVSLGDKIEVKVKEVDSQGRVNLTRKGMAGFEEAGEKAKAAGGGGAPEARGERGDRGGDRGGRGGDRGGRGGDRGPSRGSSDRPPRTNADSGEGPVGFRFRPKKGE
ncbi:MAG TPA: polyribonucleotide nucleotidyltransferase [Armatimonadota bacterium]|jgi:polyribonucleotide nucleotidyltransferase